MVAQEKQQASGPESSMPLAEPQPTHEQIASLAYALWRERGCPEGSSEEDWFKAEEELLGRREA